MKTESYLENFHKFTFFFSSLLTKQKIGMLIESLRNDTYDDFRSIFASMQSHTEVNKYILNRVESLYYSLIDKKGQLTKEFNEVKDDKELRKNFAVNHDKLDMWLIHNSLDMEQGFVSFRNYVLDTIKQEVKDKFN